MIPQRKNTLEVQELINELPVVRGRYVPNADLGAQTWFRTGGTAEVLYKPEDLADLVFFLKNKPSDIPVRALGIGSNVLVRDSVIPGVVIKLGRGFSNVVVQGNLLEVSAGMLDRNIAMVARDWGLSGLEFLTTIPGNLGGALRMNAGCYGREMKDIVKSAMVIDPKGIIRRFTPQQLGMTYRHCNLPEDWIFVGATLEGTPGDKTEISRIMDEMIQQRDETQPTQVKTGGSTFANPPGHKAWELIDKAGCRGLTIGGAMMSEKHCNFMINTGTATPKDLESLGEEVRRRVFATTGVVLEWEIQRLGKL